MVFGKSVTAEGIVFFEGLTLEEVVTMSKDMCECEQSLYDMFGDIAIEHNLIGDLAKRIIELEAKLGSQNSETKAP